MMSTVKPTATTTDDAGNADDDGDTTAADTFSAADGAAGDVDEPDAGAGDDVEADDVDVCLFMRMARNQMSVGATSITTTSPTDATARTLILVRVARPLSLRHYCR